MRKNFVTKFMQLLKLWLCEVWSGIVVEKNWALSVDQWRLQTLQLSIQICPVQICSVQTKQFSVGNAFVYVNPRKNRIRTDFRDLWNLAMW